MNNSDSKENIEDNINSIKTSITSLKSKIDDIEIRAKNVSLKASAYPKFTFIILVTILIILAFYANKYYSKLGEINANISTNIKREVSNQIKSTVPDSVAENLKYRLNYLEKEQELVINSSKQSMEKMNLIFGTVVAFLTIFSLFFGYRQIVIEARKDENQQLHDQEMRGLVGSFQENIIKINSLISTLEKSYSYRKEISGDLEDFKTGLYDLKKSKLKEEESLNRQIQTLNIESFNLFNKLDRTNFKQDNNKKKILEFANKLGLLIIKESPDRFNPFVFFISALNFFNNTQYPSSRQEFLKSFEKVQYEISHTNWEIYPRNVEQQIIKNELERMLRDCAFHLGIMNYNLGNYDEAYNNFNEVYLKDNYELKALIYLPELLFFKIKSKEECPQVEKEYQRIIQIFQGKSEDIKNSSLWKESYSTLKMREGNYYIRKGIEDSFIVDYRKSLTACEDPSRAIECYEEAKEYSSSPFVIFSLAQSLNYEGKAFSKASEETNALFAQSFFEFSKRIINYTEPILLLQINYMLAICASEAKIGNSANFYLANSRMFLKDIPSEIKIFSPINKIPLSRIELLEEMEKFEKILS